MNRQVGELDTKSEEKAFPLQGTQATSFCIAPS